MKLIAYSPHGKQSAEAQADPLADTVNQSAVHL